MDLRCPHCGEPVTAGMKVCPRCEADLHAVSTPKTIQELQQYCLLKNIPAEKMRFFIGEDYKEPKAFGIYQADDGRYVVYKNKADGTRAVRYEGYDEAYAVTEILQKMQSEVDLRYEKKQRSRSARNGSGNSVPPQKKRTANGCLRKTIIAWILLTVAGFGLWALSRAPDPGYYYYNDDYYYYLDDDWYRYEDDDWYPTQADEALQEDYEDYYVGYEHGDSFGIDTFYSTPYFQDYTERQSYSDYDDDDDYDSWRWDDDDDDDDWDWDDWDTDDTDWDSDW